ncbi:hypothetical protein FRC12_023583, partial [Ceratobasidium sp. 428]
MQHVLHSTAWSEHTARFDSAILLRTLCFLSTLPVKCGLPTATHSSRPASIPLPAPVTGRALQLPTPPPSAMADINEKHHSQTSFDRKDPEVGHKVDPVNDEVLAEVAGAQFDDPNIDRTHLGDLEEDSPYPEVRSAVANTDDPDMPANTFRAWVLGIIWAILLPGLNQFFFFRYPSVTIGNLVAQLISYPMGRFLAYVLPRRRIFGIDLNPGPFSIKEHVLITVMATVGATSAYATDIVAVQRVFYGQTWNFSYQWMVV